VTDDKKAKLVQIPAGQMAGLSAIANAVLNDAMSARQHMIDAGLPASVVETLLGSVYLKIAVYLSTKPVKDKLPPDLLKEGLHALVNGYVDHDIDIEAEQRGPLQ
jgi:hypothetical protein